MKKILPLILIVLFFLGCNNDEEAVKEEVELNFDYTFVESGDMSRSGSTLYTKFYDSYVKTKMLTPKTYSLTFKNKSTGAIAEVKGEWSKKDAIRLLEGTYEVTGVSNPVYPAKAADLDTLSIAFNEEVVINKNTTSVVLTALHSSYMLIFNEDNISEIKYDHFMVNPAGGQVEVPLPKKDNIYFMFLRALYWNTSDRNLIYIKRANDLESKIYLDDVPFQKGKYYYYDDLTNSFNIPPMQEGN